MADIKLKPCPFCGNEFPTIEEAYGCWKVRCPDCRIVFMCDCTAGHDESKEETLESWNMRSSDG